VSDQHNISLTADVHDLTMSDLEDSTCQVSENAKGLLAKLNLP
jgi:hypothetical protein